MGAPLACPVCGSEEADLAALAGHLVTVAERSDPAHVMWLNRTVTRTRMAAADLEPLLAAALSGGAPAGDRVRR